MTDLYQIILKINVMLKSKQAYIIVIILSMRINC